MYVSVIIQVLLYILWYDFPDIHAQWLLLLEDVEIFFASDTKTKINSRHWLHACFVYSRVCLCIVVKQSV